MIVELATLQNPPADGHDHVPSGAREEARVIGGAEQGALADDQVVDAVDPLEVSGGTWAATWARWASS